MVLYQLSYARFLEEVAKNLKFDLSVNAFLIKNDTKYYDFKKNHNIEQIFSIYVAFIK